MPPIRQRQVDHRTIQAGQSTAGSTFQIVRKGRNPYMKWNFSRSVTTRILGLTAQPGKQERPE